jgi:hypothetical protein
MVAFCLTFQSPRIIIPNLGFRVPETVIFTVLVIVLFQILNSGCNTQEEVVGRGRGTLGTNYSNPSVYEQSVYDFSLIRDAQINTCFSIYEPIFACTSSFLSQMIVVPGASSREVMGN